MYANLKYLCVTPSLPESHVWNHRKYGAGVQFRAVELEFFFLLIFRLFPTFRLADSTDLVQLDFVTSFCRENAKEESTHMGRKFSAFPAVF